MKQPKIELNPVSVYVILQVCVSLFHSNMLDQISRLTGQFEKHLDVSSHIETNSPFEKKKRKFSRFLNHALKQKLKGHQPQTRLNFFWVDCENLLSICSWPVAAHVF